MLSFGTIFGVGLGFEFLTPAVCEPHDCMYGIMFDLVIFRLIIMRSIPE